MTLIELAQDIAAFAPIPLNTRDDVETAVAEYSSAGVDSLSPRARQELERIIWDEVNAIDAALQDEADELADVRHMEEMEA